MQPGPCCDEQIQGDISTYRSSGNLLVEHPHALDTAYRRMAHDTERESAAMEWAEALIGDVMTPQPYIPNRGDIIWITVGQKPEYHRAERSVVVVVSPADYNEKSGLALVCPIASRAADTPFEVRIPGELPVRGVVLADAVRSVDLQASHAIRACALPEDAIADVLRKLNALLA
jgi:mRNA interferase MazF